MKLWTLLQNLSKLLDLLCAPKFCWWYLIKAYFILQNPRIAPLAHFIIYVKLSSWSSQLFFKGSPSSQISCVLQKFGWWYPIKAYLISQSPRITSCSFHHLSEALFVKLLTLLQNFSRLSNLLYAPKICWLVISQPSSHSYGFFSIFLIIIGVLVCLDKNSKKVTCTILMVGIKYKFQFLTK